MEQDKRAKAEEWVRCAFADDIIPAKQSGLDEDYISLCPNVEAGSWLLITEHYTGIRYEYTGEAGIGNGQKIRMSSFLNLFSNIINPNKLSENILNELIEYSEEKKLYYSWYFRLRLEKIRYGNFVDVRRIFADLYSMYLMPEDSEGNPTDRPKMLQGILTANRKFKAFMKDEEQKSIEGEKEFFAL
jgi:hypothetical protein